MSGRPPKMSAAKHRALCEAVALGMTFSDACVMAGVSWRTFLRWRRMGETQEQEGVTAEESVYVRFWRDVTRAETRAKARALASVQEGISRDPALAMKWLTSRYPEEYGKRVADVVHRGHVSVHEQRETVARLEVSLTDLIDVSGLPDHLLDQAVQLFAAIDAWQVASEITDDPDRALADRQRRIAERTGQPTVIDVPAPDDQPPSAKGSPVQPADDQRARTDDQPAGQPASVADQLASMLFDDEED